MKEVTVRRLIGTWCLLMISLPLAIIWIRPDFVGGKGVPAALKLCAILAAVSAGALAFTYALYRKWSLPIKRFEEFIAALPGREIDLPEAGPPEMQSLSRAI